MIEIWKPNVTHVITSMNEHDAYNRLQKVLMAILNEKWIVTPECKHLLTIIHYRGVSTPNSVNLVKRPVDIRCQPVQKTRGY